MTAADYETDRVVDTVVSNTDVGLTNTDVATDWENSLAVNPRDPCEIVALGFSGSWDPSQGLPMPLWHSRDGGELWTKRYTVPVPPGPFFGPGDLTLDWGSSGDLSISILAQGPGGLNVVSVITDDVIDQVQFRYRVTAGVTQLTNNAGVVGFADQPWTLVNRDPLNPHRENTYVAYDDFTGPGNSGSDGIEGPDMRVAVSYGEDPLNFTVDRQIGNSVGFVNPGLRMAKDTRTGAMFALFQRCPGVCDVTTDPKSINYMLNRSVDGGNSWSLNGSASGTPIATGLSTQPWPKFGGVNALLGGAHHAAVDSRNGAVYYVYGNQDAYGNDRMAIRRLTIDGPGNVTVGPENFVTLLDAAIPQVAVDDVGTVAVFFYSLDGFAASGRPIFTAHLSVSVDQGVTFTDRTLLTFESPEAFDGSQFSGQRVLGDYQNLKSLDGCFYGVFTGNGAPLGRPFDNTDVIYYQVCRDDHRRFGRHHRHIRECGR